MLNHSRLPILIWLWFGIVLLSFLLPQSFVSSPQHKNITPEFDDKGIAMVYVPSGEFMMGVELEKAITLCQLLIPQEFRTVGCNPETHVEMHFSIEPIDIAIDAFYIDQYEVSLQNYLDCVEAHVCDQESLGLQLNEGLESGDVLPLNQPFQRVNYFNAAVYCAWREARLPTEAEWEYASRGEENLIFPWGNEFDPARLNFGNMLYQTTPQLLWDDTYQQLAPVDTFENGQSWVGVYNLAGNAAEWTSTQFVNDDGVSDYNTRIVKGGSFLSYAHETAGWARMPLGQIGIPEGIGFRCARNGL